MNRPTQNSEKNPRKSWCVLRGSKWETRDSYAIVGKSFLRTRRAWDMEIREGGASGGRGVVVPLQRERGQLGWKGVRRGGEDAPGYGGAVAVEGLEVWTEVNAIL